MAALTLADLRKRYGRVETFVGMMKHKVPFAMVNGDQKVISRIGFTDRSGRITEFNPSKDPRHYSASIEWLKTRASSGATIILMTDKERFALKEVSKTSDFGGGKGGYSDLAEAIFAIAVYCRFSSKNTNIDEIDILKILNVLEPLREKQILSVDSPNKVKGISDKTSITLCLSPGTLLTITDRITQPTLKTLIQSAVNYANSQSVSVWSQTLFENNKYNKIEIFADGTLKQAENKIDVYVTINDKVVDIGVGLKDTDVKLFGKILGSGFDDQSDFWNSIIGIDPGSYEKDYYVSLKNGGDFLDAIREVYKGMAYEINNRLRSNISKVFSSLSKGVISYVTMGKPFVSVAPLLTKQEINVLNFNNLSLLLSTTTIRAAVSNKSIPELYLIDNRNNILLTIRCIQHNNKIKNVIVKGALLIELSKFTIA